MDLPMEVVVEIMSLLPAESLVRLKCVCRLWYSIINDRVFVAKHLHNANKISSAKSLFSIGYSEELHEPVRSFITIRDDDRIGYHIDSVFEDSMSVLLQQHADEYHIGSQCNGIFCLYGEENYNVMLCNPVTKEFKLLPDSCFRVKMHVLMLGFGFDPSVDCYKVVRAVLLSSQGDYLLRAETYTLGSSTWREIKMNLLLSELELILLGIAYGRNAHKQRYCNGAFYWLLSPLSEKETIVCFDTSDEQFYRIPLPDNFEGERKGMSTSLDVWNESVALLHYPNSSNITRPIEIWLMVDSSCGSEASCCWTKYLSIGPLESIWRPVAFWRINELLMSAEDGHVVSCNLHTQDLRNLPISPQALKYNAFVYVKSLVSVHGRN